VVGRHRPQSVARRHEVVCFWESEAYFADRVSSNHVFMWRDVGCRPALESAAELWREEQRAAAQHQKMRRLSSSASFSTLRSLSQSNKSSGSSSSSSSSAAASSKAAAKDSKEEKKSQKKGGDKEEEFSSLLFDHINRTIRVREDPRIKTRVMRSRGGILADQM
jgi:hypothetical protein